MKEKVQLKVWNMSIKLQYVPMKKKMLNLCESHCVYYVQLLLQKTSLIPIGKNQYRTDITSGIEVN